MLFVELEHQRLEPAVFHDGAVECGVAAQDQRGGARRPFGIDVVWQRLAVEIEDMGHPQIAFQQHGLNQHAAQKAVEHHDINRLEGFWGCGQQVVELGKLGVGQVAVDMGGG